MQKCEKYPLFAIFERLIFLPKSFFCCCRIFKLNRKSFDQELCSGRDYLERVHCSGLLLRYIFKMAFFITYISFILAFFKQSMGIEKVRRHFEMSLMTLEEVERGLNIVLRDLKDESDYQDR